jgi:putative flippase GtrA
MLQYAIVGGLATLVHYLVLVGLVEQADTNAALAAMIGAGCGALAAYLGNFRFTFSSNAAHRNALPRFLLVAAGGALASASLVWLGTQVLQLHYLVPQAAATALVFVAGFSMNRRWTFA